MMEGADQITGRTGGAYDLQAPQRWMCDIKRPPHEFTRAVQDPRLGVSDALRDLNLLHLWDHIGGADKLRRISHDSSTKHLVAFQDDRERILHRLNRDFAFYGEESRNIVTRILRISAVEVPQSLLSGG